MVDTTKQVLLEEMRETQGFKLLAKELQEIYLNAARTLISGSCNSLEELSKQRTRCAVIREILIAAGASKEELKWMELR